jgi:hypothetical protein
MGDERERQERAPLWKRAVWHALKTLVRKHPGALLSAAASGAGYAVKQGVEESAEGSRKSMMLRSGKTGSWRIKLRS